VTVRSCLYTGSVRHRRIGAVPDEFRQQLFMVYLDLQELPELFDGSLLFSARRPALAWFRRADYLGDPRQPLGEAVRDLVGSRTGARPEGPVRLLTHLRYLGHCFNPVSFYYCFDASGERVSAVVAEVTNTPWGERHAYVMPLGEAFDRPTMGDRGTIEDHSGRTDCPPTNDRTDHGTATVMRRQFDKQLHVSPLMSMDLRYDWRLTVPAEQLLVHIQARRNDNSGDSDRCVFDATLSLRRREIDAASLRRILLRYPLMTLRIQTRIYSHALRLRLRGARWYPHPGSVHTGTRHPGSGTVSP
jgi:DUF1365 family protein